MSAAPAPASPAERLEAFLARAPYGKFIGMRAEMAGDELIFGNDISF